MITGKYNNVVMITVASEDLTYSEHLERNGVAEFAVFLFNVVVESVMR